ncbi:MAG TPA: hypothetical protein DEG44_00065, partial [Candidatus Kerfeldbacteria bacterium]|nr:hypothetical protein [Candidatus Kerfeldbacteria bacterium]
MDAATKLAFNVPFSHAVVLINAEQAQLWVVYTLEQYAAVDTAHGTFDHDEIRLLGAAMYRDVPEVQQVSGP